MHVVSRSTRPSPQATPPPPTQPAAGIDPEAPIGRRLAEWRPPIRTCGRDRLTRGASRPQVGRGDWGVSSATRPRLRCVALPPATGSSAGMHMSDLDRKHRRAGEPSARLVLSTTGAAAGRHPVDAARAANGLATSTRSTSTSTGSRVCRHYLGVAGHGRRPRGRTWRPHLAPGGGRPVGLRRASTRAPQRSRSPGVGSTGARASERTRAPTSIDAAPTTENGNPGRRTRAGRCSTSPASSATVDSTKRSSLRAACRLTSWSELVATLANTLVVVAPGSGAFGGSSRRTPIVTRSRTATSSCSSSPSSASTGSQNRSCTTSSRGRRRSPRRRDRLGLPTTEDRHRARR